MQNGQPASRGVSFAFLCHVAHFGVTFMALHSIFRSSSSTNSHSPGHTGGGYLHLGTQCQRNRSHRLTISEHFIEQSQHNFLFYCTRSLPLFFLLLLLTSTKAKMSERIIQKKFPDKKPNAEYYLQSPMNNANISNLVKKQPEDCISN